MHGRTAPVLLLALLVGVAPAWAQSIQTDDNIETDGQLVSTVGTGTPPLEVSSLTTVRNLSADFVDGIHGTTLSTMLMALQDQLGALHTAAPACPNDSGDRYVNCNNGTVTDNDTGLVWLANANCLGQTDWFNAMATASGLTDLECPGAFEGCDCGLSDGSSPGDWRLASWTEWKEVLASDCSPSISSDAGDTCWSQECYDAGNCSFYGVEGSDYWSSSTLAPPFAPSGVTHAAIADLLDGSSASSSLKTSNHYFWPVRGGQ